MSNTDLRTLAMIGLSLPQIARALSLSQYSVRSLLRRRGLYAGWKSKRAYLRKVKL